MKNLVSWIEIPALNFKRAVEFYNGIFNVELEEIDCGEEKMACFPTGEGAISFAPGFKPSKNGVIVSLNVENEMDNVIKRIENNGGKLIKSKTKIQAEGRGYFALFYDIEGNRMGLYGDS